MAWDVKQAEEFLPLGYIAKMLGSNPGGVPTTTRRYFMHHLSQHVKSVHSFFFFLRGNACYLIHDTIIVSKW